MSRKAPPLPKDLAELVERVGRDDAFRLVREFGGTKIYVPKVPAAGQKLWERLGPRVAGALSELFGGDTLFVPLAGTGGAAARRRAILEDDRSANAVARTHGVHKVSVHRLRGKAKKAHGGRQLDIFGTPKQS